ncbi:MAG: hypothetical protein QOE75_84 [Solirubrobacterales bacterium]|nr:hypothetical protein [Solirubrobacterales bacterium]
MHALKGTDLRRRVIIAEFLLAAVGGLGVGLYLLLGVGGTVGTILGLYAIGVAANYVPLAIHALSLRRPARLREELRGVDLRGELRHYTLAQFWVFVPLLFVWFELSGREG